MVSHRHNDKSVYLRFRSWPLEIWQFQYRRQGRCNGRCSWICKSISGGSDAVRHRWVIAILHICVGSAHCSSFYDGHMPEPQEVGRAKVRYPRFLYTRPSQGISRTETPIKTNYA